jgi:clan AA aspartic protease (TIGR02281 family)
MRGLAGLCLMLLAGAAQAALLDPSRMAAIDQAADAFLAKAAVAKKTGQVPRQSDPAVGPLLDIVFDTNDLNHGPLDYGDVDKLDHWLARLNAVGRVYLTAAKQAHDTGLFGAEIGRYYDASAAVVQAMVDCQIANLDAHPGAKLSDADQRKLATLRTAVATAFGSQIEVFTAPGLTVGWAQDRLNALSAAAPSMARFLTAEQLAKLRATTRQMSERTRSKPLRASFERLAAVLAEPPPPPPASTQAPPDGAEIALEADKWGYSVSGRVNDAMTVKFVVDSGAGVVALPKDIVDTLTQSGTIAPSDILGRDTYVTADGKKHKGTALMLRRLDIGGHIVTNVMASVGPAHTAPLLGQSFFTKFKSWTLDNKRHVLIISE